MRLTQGGRTTRAQRSAERGSPEIQLEVVSTGRIQRRKPGASKAFQGLPRASKPPNRDEQAKATTTPRPCARRPLTTTPRRMQAIVPRLACSRAAWRNSSPHNGARCGQEGQGSLPRLGRVGRSGLWRRRRQVATTRRDQSGYSRGRPALGVTMAQMQRLASEAAWAGGSKA